MEPQNHAKNAAQGKALPRQAAHASDLRSTLECLRAQGDLIETDKPVDPDLEVTGLPEAHGRRLPGAVQQGQRQARYRVLTNLFGDIKVITRCSAGRTTPSE